MPLNWNEIRQRAITFSRDWADASSERAEAQTFWNEFFYVFGKHRRTVATFEESVHSVTGSTHRIDVFWSTKLIGEHKSRGQDLSKAYTQAVGYITDLINEGREAISAQRHGVSGGRPVLTTDEHRWTRINGGGGYTQGLSGSGCSGSTHQAIASPSVPVGADFSTVPGTL